MHQFDQERISPVPRLKMAELSKFASNSKKNLSSFTENKVHVRNLSLPGSQFNFDIPKHLPVLKNPESPRECLTGRVSDTKMDINFTLSPLLIQQSPTGHTDFLVKSTRARIQKENSSLPKLLNHDLTVGKLIKKNLSKLMINNSNEFKPGLYDKLSLENKTYRKRIEYLEEKNKNLLEMFKMRNDDDEKTAVLHMASFHEDSKEEGDPNKKNPTLRAQLNSLKVKVVSLEKENEELREKVKKYKNLVSTVNLEGPELQILEKLKQYDSEDTNSVRGSDTTIIKTKNMAYKAVDVALHDRLANLFRQFSRVKSLHITLETAVMEACKIFDSGYARILLTSELGKKIFHKSGSEKMKSNQMTLGIHEVEIIERKEESWVDSETLNLADNINGLKRAFTNDGRALSCPIYSVLDPSEFWGAIQVSESMIARQTKVRRGRGFGVKDEFLLEIYAKIIGLLIDFHHQEWLKKEHERRVTTYNDSMTHIISSRSHQDLLESVKAKLTNYFDFESIGLMFYDAKEDKLFSFDLQKKPNGRYYTTEPLKFPTKLGLSGQCISQDIEYFALNEPKKNRQFQAEVDNISGAAVVRNIIIALLRDEKGRKTGILQLVNKRNNQAITDKDEVVVRDIQRLLGALVAHTNDIHLAVNLSYEMNKAVKVIETQYNPLEGLYDQ